jgi:peptidoglycan/LPS O-acetylase OafA/YrhL
LGILLVGHLRGIVPAQGFFIWFIYLGNYAELLFPGRNLQTVGPMLVGHFWTLCIEEQFYILWPAVVFLVRDRKILIRICAVVVCLALLARGILVWAAPSYVLGNDLLFRGTPFRCDSLLMGAACALVARGPRNERLVRLSCRVLPLCALAFLICISINYLAGVRIEAGRQPWLLSAGLSIIDAGCAALIVACTNPASALSRLLSNRRIRSFGRYTYGFYVFHAIPLGSFRALTRRLTTMGLAAPMATTLTLLMAFVLTSVAAFLSYRFFESPLLRLKERFAAYQYRKGNAKESS